MNLADALGAMVRGDPRPLRDILGELPATADRDWVGVWSTTSVLYGTVCGSLAVRQGSAVYPLTIEHHPMQVTGGAPREAVLDDCLPALRDALARPPTVEFHRVSARSLIERLQQAAREGAEPMTWDPAVALLRHHTDLPVDIVRGRVPVMSPDALAREEAILRPLASVLDDPRSFRAHLEEGLMRPPGPRRTLAGWLTSLP